MNWKKIGIGVALFILIGIALTLKFGGSIAGKLVEQEIAKQTTFEGKISYKDIEAGLAGDIKLTDVKWTSPKGEDFLFAPVVTMSVDLLEAILPGAEKSVFNSIIIEKPTFKSNYDKEKGLDLISYINFADSKSSEIIDDVPTKFRGTIEIKDGSGDIRFDNKQYVFSKIQMLSLFNQYPQVKYDFMAAYSGSNIILNIIRDQEKIALSGEAKDAKVEDLMSFLPRLKDVFVKKGDVATATFKGEQKDNKWQFEITGNIRNLEGSILGWNATEGKGAFKLTNNVLDLNKIELKIEGTPLEVSGDIKTVAAENTEKGEYNLTFSGKQFPIRSLSQGIDATGTLNFEGTVKGDVLNPLIEGMVTSEGISAKGFNVASIRGSYKQIQDRVMLDDVVGYVNGIRIKMSATLAAANKAFIATIDGIGIKEDKTLGRRYIVDGKSSIGITGSNILNSANAEQMRKNTSITNMSLIMN